MKIGKASLQELAIEIDRQAKAKRDFLADTRELAVLAAHGEPGNPRPFELHVQQQGEFNVRSLAHGQIAEFLGMPRKWYDHLLTTQPDILGHDINELFRRVPGKRMIRTMDGDVRAFLSNGYRRLDNDQLIQAILPMLSEIPDVEFPSVEVTENKLYIKAVAPRLQAEVKKGDIIQAGVVISNSEVGQGALSVRTLLFRLICKNGLIGEEMVRAFHVGRRIEITEGVTQEIFAEETIRADDNAFWLQVRDLTKAAVSEANFQTAIRRMQLIANSEPLQDVPAGVKVLATRYGLTEGEENSVLNHLIKGGDLTQYGVLNAVTRASQDVESYDRATELEALGGDLLVLKPADWRVLATATA